MSESSNPRRPWWTLGAGIISSTVLTLVFAYMLATSIARLVAGPVVWWESLFAIAAALLVVCGLASMARFARDRRR